MVRLLAVRIVGRPPGAESFTEMNRLGPVGAGLCIGQINLIAVWASLARGSIVVRAFWAVLLLMTMWYGFIRFFIGSTKNFKLPEGAVGYYSRFLVTVRDPFVGEAGLHFSILYVLIIGVLIHCLLKYTTLGRGIYAMGGNREVAIRSGFNIKGTLLVVFGILGVLSAFAGVTHSFLSRHFEPTLFMTQNLDVIAAVILGGASVTGGKGSVLGTFMGVILIQLINRAMVLTGITVEWQQLMIGLVLAFFISIPAIRDLINKRASRAVEVPEEI